jgi:spore germination cell wall hydrolase CwlJ-like protein
LRNKFFTTAALAVILYLLGSVTDISSVAQEPNRELVEQFTSQSVKPAIVVSQRDRTEIECLARNVYHEARGEGHRGMEAVAYVTINRVKSGRFQNTVCSVISAPGQFVWYGKGYGINESGPWAQAKRVANNVYWTHDKSSDPTAGSLYFHADSGYRSPRKIKIGNHLFYR